MTDISGLTVDEKRELLRELTEAISTGAKKVKFNEREVTYRSLGEMRSIQKDLENSIRGGRRSNVILTTFDRGY